jgi:hypothetical protein
VTAPAVGQPKAAALTALLAAFHNKLPDSLVNIALFLFCSKPQSRKNPIYEDNLGMLGVCRFSAMTSCRS